MSRWPAEPIALHLGGAGNVLAGTPLAAAAGDWPALAAELAQKLAPGTRLDVRLVDCWSRYFLFETPVGVSGLRDSRLLLDARFEALYGQPPADWLLRADWQAGAPMLACAVPRALEQALAGFRLARLAPATLRSWNRHCATLPATGLWCGADDGMFNLLYWHEGQLRLVRQQRGDDLDGLLALELARLGAAMPAARFCSGRAIAGWTALEAA
ncbi:MAG: hypothetical protein ABIT83_16490 [Massilia sp.]